MGTCFSNRRPSQWVAQIAGVKKANLFKVGFAWLKLTKRTIFGTIEY